MSSTIQRQRLSGGRQRGPLILGLLGALLLGGLVWIASTDAPTPSPTPIPPSVIAEATPKPANEQTVFMVTNGYSALELTAYSTDYKEIQRYGPAFQYVINDDGTTAYIVYNSTLRRIDLASGTIVWRSPLELGQEFRTKGLAIAPNQTTLALIHTRNTADLQTNWIIDWYDASNGSLLTSQSIPLPFDLQWMALAADGQRLYVSGEKDIAMVDRDAGKLTNVLSASSPIPHTMNHDGTKLFVVLNNNLVVIDTASPSMASGIPLAIDPIRQPLGNTLAISPNEERIALLYGPSDMEAISIDRGRVNLNNVAVDVAQFNTSDGSLAQPIQRVNAASVFGEHALAYRPDNQTLFASIGNRAAFVNPDGTVQERTPPESWASVQIRPQIEYAVTDSNNQAYRELEVPNTGWTQQIITTTSVTMPDSQPFVWLNVFDSNSGNAAIIALAPDGSRTTIAKNVVATIPRQGQPPLLIQDGETFNTHALFDPVTSQTWQLGLQLDLEESNTVIGSFTTQHFAEMSPDGQQVAVITTENDQKGLWIVDLATGDLRNVIDSNRWNTIKKLSIMGWSAGGIDFLEIGENSRTDLDLSTNFEPQHIDTYSGFWRVDPSGTLEPTQLWERESEARAVYHPESQQLLYQPVSDNAARGELHVLDFKTNDDRIIYTGPYLQAEFFSISPDGNWVIYARPNDPLQRSSTLVAYRIHDGFTQQLDPSMEWGHPVLTWINPTTLILDGYDETYAVYDHAEYYLEQEHDPHKPSTTLAPLDAPGAANKPYRVGLSMEAYTDIVLVRITRDTGKVDVMLPIEDVTVFQHITSSIVVYYP